ncbi:MAG: hypothetical protein ABI779_20790 [Acidobacteriota bacterium]
MTRALQFLVPGVLALAGVLGCTSTQSTSSAPKPSVTIEQTSDVNPFDSVQSTGVPVEYRLDFENPLDHDVTLTSVEIETVGNSGGYTMKRVRHAFSQPILAHGKSSIALRAWVQPLQLSDTGQIATPVMLRGSAQFDSLGSRIRTSFVGRVKAIPSRF